MKRLIVLLALAGCAAPAPATKIVTVTPTLPAGLLTCAPAPEVPAAVNQSVVANYIVALWQAGQDCRAHVAAISQLFSNQSRPQ
jgi:hypothetical protein